MGGQRAALALYTGEWITADDAVACGLALRAVEPDALMPETMELARPHRQDAGALAASRRSGSCSPAASTRSAPPAPGKTRRSPRMVGAPANLEALTAFLEKREPDFRSAL